MTARLRAWAKGVRRDALTLWLAARDPRVPWAAKALCGAVAAYALSPIDLIPDWIPILGLVDEALLLPLAILLVARLIPTPLLAALRAEAAARADRPVSLGGAAVVAALWCACAALAWAWLA